MSHGSSLMLVEESADQRRPDRHGICCIDKEMPVAAVWWKQMVFGIAAGGGEGRMHPLRQFGSEIGVVLDIHPQHRHSRRAAELAGGFNQLLGRTVVIGLAVDAAAAPGGKGDDRLDRWRVDAR